MASCRTERGFALLELLVCVAIVAVAGAAAAGAAAALARNAGPAGARDLALMTAENVLVRARAAVAYVPASAVDAAAAATDRSWALRPGVTAWTAQGELRGPDVCGRTSQRVLLPVTSEFDSAAQRFTVTVAYPRDPCLLSADGTIPDGDAVTLTQSTVLAPSVFPPGTVIERPVAPPESM